MKRLFIVVALAAAICLMPAQAFAHHVGMAEESMPADQWLYVDTVAHGVGSSGDADMDIAPGADMASENMSGENSWMVAGQANMSTP